MRGSLIGMGSGAILGGSSWTPATPGNVLAWYTAAQIYLYEDTAGFDPVEDTDTVARWNDRGGNGFHLTQATGIARPQYLANGWNGNRATVSFGGGGKFLASTAAGFADYLNGTSDPITLFMTVNVPSAGTYQHIAVWREDPGISSVQSYRIADLGAGDLLQADNTNGTATGTGNPAGGRKRLAFLQGSGTVDGYIDATLDINAGTQGGALGGQNSFLLGISALGTLGFQGDISELVIYSAKRNATDWANYRTYSASVWGG